MVIWVEVRGIVHDEVQVRETGHDEVKVEETSHDEGGGQGNRSR